MDVHHEVTNPLAAPFERDAEETEVVALDVALSLLGVATSVTVVA